MYYKKSTEKSECVVNNNRDRIRIEMRNWDAKDLDEILKDYLNEIRSKPGNRRDNDRILLGTITSNIKIRSGIFTRIDPIEVSEAGVGSLSIPSGAVVELIEFEPHEQIEKLGKLILIAIPRSSAAAGTRHSNCNHIEHGVMRCSAALLRLGQGIPTATT